jgi:hypothetical protein
MQQNCKIRSEQRLERRLTSALVQANEISLRTVHFHEPRFLDRAIFGLSKDIFLQPRFGNANPFCRCYRQLCE